MAARARLCGRMSPATADAEAEINKPRVTEFLLLLDGELAGRKFAAGDRFSVADITGLVAIDLMKPAKLSVDPYPHVRRWHAEISARPS